MTKNRAEWIIYGAYGYTGELVLKDALAKGRRPILAGRSEAKLKPIAEAHGLPYRVFSVEDAAQNIEGAGTLINCAGPFDITSEPMMDACLERGLNYFDISGEIAVFQAAYARTDKAKRAGVILCPGVGFDIVPTDCLASLLKKEIPDATHFELAFDFGTLPSMGTTRTGIQAIGDGSFVRENDQIKDVGLGHDIHKIQFAAGPKWSVCVPWADVFTTQVSVGIPNVIVFGAMPWIMCWSMKLISPFKKLLARPGGQKFLIAAAGKVLSDGPDADARANAPTGFWARAKSADGRQCTATITGPSVYALTADLSTAIALFSETWEKDGGYFTASMLGGADFLSNRDGYSVVISPVTSHHLETQA